MGTNPSTGDGPPTPRPSADTSSPPTPQPFEKEKNPVAATVAEPKVPLNQASSESTKAQPARTSEEEPLLKLQVQLKRENTETKIALASVKSQYRGGIHLSDMGEGSHNTPADGLGDVEMLDSAANDSDNSEAEADDDDDSDFHSQSDSDSDSSEKAGSRGKQRRPRAGTASTSPASAFLQAIESLRDQLLTRKMNQGLTGNEPQMLEQLENQVLEAQSQLDQNSAIKKKEATEKKKKERRRIAKTAREYWQRELEEEAKREAEREAKEEEKKRKCEDGTEGPNKAQKTAAESPPRQSTKQSASTARASMFHSLGNMDQSVQNGNVPTMGAIQARTHGDQWKQIKQGFPDGYDSRRAKTQLKDFHQAVSSFGYKKVDALDGRWKLKGMTTGLLDYQIVVSAWMAKREAQELHPAGGLLADDMGMGKTITTLACIVGHPPEKEDRDEFSRATLVVVNNRQNAVQWSNEIEKHCDEKFFGKTDIFTKDRRNWKAERWGRLNVVQVFLLPGLRRELTRHRITTYTELVAQFPGKKALQALKAKWAGDPAGFERALTYKLGKLFKVNWYRVILDEAHTIKNRTSCSE